MTVKKGNVGHYVLGKSWAAWVGAWFVDLLGIPCIPSSLSTEFDRVCQCVQVIQATVE